jgi:hypothetical protein
MYLDVILILFEKCGHNADTEICFFLYLSYLCEYIIFSLMAQTNFYIGKTENSAGESEISLRLYVSRDVRIRVGSGIWVDRKRWGKKNDINIPLIQSEEREMLLDKRTRLKALTDYLENVINTCEDKSIINRELIEKEIKKFYKPARKQVVPVEESFFDIMKKYLSSHKLSVPRQKNFKVIMRCLQRFELFRTTDRRFSWK